MEIASVARTSRLRRIVTGHDAAGRSIVAEDGPPSPVLEFFPGAGLYEIWTDVDGRPQTEREAPARLLPPPGGVKFRWFTVLPVAPGVVPGELARFYDDAFAVMAERDVRPDTARHPGMHETDTLDFIIVIEGRVRLILEQDERVLGPGDVVVQRGTNHAWACEGDAPALLAAILIDKSASSRAASQDGGEPAH